MHEQLKKFVACKLRNPGAAYIRKAAEWIALQHGAATKQCMDFIHLLHSRLLLHSNLHQLPHTYSRLILELGLQPDCSWHVFWPVVACWRLA